MECILFEGSNPAACWRLFSRLRDLFGKRQVSSEDALRAESLRKSTESDGEAQYAASPEEFLSVVRPVMEFSFEKDSSGPRPLELVNKTNQFNLNGRRYTEAEWRKHLADQDSFLLVASYQDKFGPLGTVAVVTGTIARKRITVTSWVVSCRAFSRGVEHACIEKLFESFVVDQICFDYTETLRNRPFRRFFRAMTGDDPAPFYALKRERFINGRSSLQPVVGRPLNNIDARLTRCFAAAFPDVSETEAQVATVDNTESWDSMGTLTLGVLIEEEFGLSIDKQVLPTLRSFQAVRDELASQIELLQSE